LNLSQENNLIMDNYSIVTYGDLIRDLSNLGVKYGDTLNVKASLKSIGMIDGGASTLINALVDCVGDQGTIVTDSFVHSFPLPIRRVSNAFIVDSKTPSYAGALANAMINDSRSFRSYHPIQKFTAIGKHAKELMSNHQPSSYAYDVLRVLMENDGKNLKIGSDEKVYGFGTTHVAIGQLSHRQKRRKKGVYYKDDKGSLKLFQVNWSSIGHGVNKFIPKYRSVGAILSRGFVGYAPAIITDMKSTYKVEIDVLKHDPSFHLCDSPLCASCRLSWEYSDYSLAEYMMVNKYKLSLKMVLEAFAIKTIYEYPF